MDVDRRESWCGGVGGSGGCDGGQCEAGEVSEGNCLMVFFSSSFRLCAYVTLVVMRGGGLWRGFLLEDVILSWCLVLLLGWFMYDGRGREILSICMGVMATVSISNKSPWLVDRVTTHDFL